MAYCKIHTCLQATSVREPVVCTTNHSQPLWLKTRTVYPSQSWRVAEPCQVVLGFHLESVWLHSRGHSVRLAARRLSSHSWGLGWGDGGSSWGLSLSRRSRHHRLHPVVAGSPQGLVWKRPGLPRARRRTHMTSLPSQCPAQGVPGQPRSRGRRNCPQRGMGETTRLYGNRRNSRPASLDTANPRAQVAFRVDDSRLLGYLFSSSGTSRVSGASPSCFRSCLCRRLAV